ncbi:hypothetical protein Tco_0499827 [Tanacetum coccineum]
MRPKRRPDKILNGDRSGFGEHLAPMECPNKISNGDRDSLGCDYAKWIMGMEGGYPSTNTSITSSGFGICTRTPLIGFFVDGDDVVGAVSGIVIGFCGSHVNGKRIERMNWVLEVEDQIDRRVLEAKRPNPIDFGFDFVISEDILLLCPDYIISKIYGNGVEMK